MQKVLNDKFGLSLVTGNAQFLYANTATTQQFDTIIANIFTSLGNTFTINAAGIYGANVFTNGEVSTGNLYVTGNIIVDGTSGNIGQVLSRTASGISYTDGSFFGGTLSLPLIQDNRSIASNVSSGAVQIRGGSSFWGNIYANGNVILSGLTVDISNLSTANAQITGGNARLTTTFTSNLSTANAVISGGYISALTNITASSASIASFTGTVTIPVINVTTSNLTTANIDGFTGVTGTALNLNVTNANLTTANIGGFTGVTGTALNLNVTNANLTTANIGGFTGVTGTALNMNVTNANLTTANIGGFTGVTGTILNINTTNANATAIWGGNARLVTTFTSNLSTANAVISGGYISALTNAIITTANVTGFTAQTGTAFNWNVTNANLTTANVGGFTGITGTALNMNITNANIVTANIGGFTGVTGTALNMNVTNANLTTANIDGFTGVTGTALNLNVTNANLTTANIGGFTGITGTALNMNITNANIANANITGGNIILSAGNPSRASLTFTAGTGLLNTAAAGSIEYDGRVFYATTQGTERGLNPAAQYYVLNAARGLATATASQTLFNQTFKVTSNTRYYYEAFLCISKANATANTLQYALVLGSGAVLAIHAYSVISKIAAARSTVAAASQMSNRIGTGFDTLVSITAATGAAAAVFDVHIQGFIDVTTGGTINPHIALATNTTTTPLLIGNSYWLMYPVGPISANTVIQ